MKKCENCGALFTPVRRQIYCDNCRKTYYQRYRQENRESIREYNRWWMRQYRSKEDVTCQQG